MAPTTINAGQVVELGIVNADFEIKGDHEFAIATFTQGASDRRPRRQNGLESEEGDPDQSQAIAVEQYRDKYIFLAPTDYDVNYVDVIEPMSAAVTIDTVAGAGHPIHRAIGILRVRRRALEPRRRKQRSPRPPERSARGHSGDGVWLLYELHVPGRVWNLSLIAPPPPK